MLSRKLIHIKTPESESALGTKLTYEDGSEVHGARRVTVSLDAAKQTVIDIQIAGGCVLDAHGIPRFHVCDPYANGEMRQVKRIEFEDGTIWMP